MCVPSFTGFTGLLFYGGAAGGVHRRHQPAAGERLGRPEHQRDRAPAAGDEGLLQSGEAGRVHQHHGPALHRRHDPPGRRPQRHPPPPQVRPRFLAFFSFIF